MYVLFFLIWVIFNGQVTTEIVLFGLVISAVVYAFADRDPQGQSGDEYGDPFL